MALPESCKLIARSQVGWGSVISITRFILRRYHDAGIVRVVEVNVVRLNEKAARYRFYIICLS